MSQRHACEGILHDRGRFLPRLTPRFIETVLCLLLALATCLLVAELVEGWLLIFVNVGAALASIGLAWKLSPLMFSNEFSNDDDHRKL